MAKEHSQPSNLVIAGMHGPPEITGLALQKEWAENTIADWQVEIANSPAVAAGKRYIKHNLSTSFHRADPNSPVYEYRRCAELLGIASSRKLVLDIHDRPDDKGEYALVGKRYSQIVLDTIGALGIKNIVVLGDNRGLVGNLKQATSLDFCRGSQNELVPTNLDRLRQVMRQVSENTIKTALPEHFQYFSYVKEVSNAEATKLNLHGTHAMNPFSPLPEKITELLGFEPGRYVAEYWKGNCSGGAEWFAGILQEIEPIPAQ